MCFLVTKVDYFQTWEAASKFLQTMLTDYRSALFLFHLIVLLEDMKRYLFYTCN